MTRSNRQPLLLHTQPPLHTLLSDSLVAPAGTRTHSCTRCDRCSCTLMRAGVTAPSTSRGRSVSGPPASSSEPCSACNQMAKPICKQPCPASTAAISAAPATPAGAAANWVGFPLGWHWGARRCCMPHLYPATCLRATPWTGLERSTPVIQAPALAVPDGPVNRRRMTSCTQHGDSRNACLCVRFFERLTPCGQLRPPASNHALHMCTCPNALQASGGQIAPCQWATMENRFCWRGQGTSRVPSARWCMCMTSPRTSPHGAQGAPPGL